MDQYKLFINGEFVDASDGKTFESFDPGSGAPIATVAVPVKPTLKRLLPPPARPSTAASGAD
jgi:acyl-CoA reductase-like NAD-dependent aldehyde dehydrogenase